MADATSPELAVDGSYTELIGHSRYYADIAEAVRGTITNLRTVTSGLNTRSDAVDAFSEIAEKVRTNLVEVEERYDLVAEQLYAYANSLSDLKARANTIQTLARDSEAAIVDARWNYYREQGDLDIMEYDDPLRPGQQRHVNRLYDTWQDLIEAVRTCDSDLDNVLADWRIVADRCADAIKGVIEGSDLNDSFWDKLAEWVENGLPILEMVLDIIAIVLTVIAIILVFTGVGAPLAAALFMVARAAQLVSKILKVIKILATIALVAAGKYPPSKLIDLAVGMAVDKVLGKVGEGALDKLGKAITDRFGNQLLTAANAVANKLDATVGGDIGDNVFDNTLKILDDGFDAWTTDVFVPELRDVTMPWESGMPGFPFAPGSTLDGLTSANKAMDSAANVLAGGLLDMMSGTPGSFATELAFGSSGVMEAIAGPSTPLSNMAYKAVDFVVSDLGGFDWKGEILGDFSSTPSAEPFRPTMSELGAN